jgi:high affinity Mn2+ porin
MRRSMAQLQPQAAPPIRPRGTLWFLVVALLAGHGARAALDVDRFAVHGQFTYVEQDTSDFSAPYRGTNSLSPGKGAETTDATVYAGARLWAGAEAWLDLEMDQGFGLDDTLGVAGFPSAEAYKVGKNQPYLRMPRLFIKQTMDLGGEPVHFDGVANVMAADSDANRLVLTVGKMSVSDIFDTNTYAHNQRADFLNWTAIDAGTFDYAADSWGYSAGAALEWYQGSWTLRGGVFDLSDIPNSAHLDPGFHEFQIDLEAEKRLELAGKSGKILLTVFDSRGRMGLLNEAVAAAQANCPVDATCVPDIAAVRHYRSRIGASLSLEQQLAPDVGLFGRWGRAGGNVEAYEFTDVDRTAVAGVSLQGARWRRADDTLGLTAIVNGISADRERYLNAGGLGILVGDGKLPRPGAEQILETYYSIALIHAVHLSFDYQHIVNPAYNRDRGPVSVYAVRLHGEF